MLKPKEASPFDMLPSKTGSPFDMLETKRDNPFEKASTQTGLNPLSNLRMPTLLQILLKVFSPQVQTMGKAVGKPV